MSERAADLIQQLLIHDPEKRLGCAKVSAKEMEARILAEEERLAALGERKTGHGGVLLEGKGDGRAGSDSVAATTSRPGDEVQPTGITINFTQGAPLLSSSSSSDVTATTSSTKRGSLEKKIVASDDTQPIEPVKDHDIVVVPLVTVSPSPTSTANEGDQKKDADAKVVEPTTSTDAASSSVVPAATDADKPAVVAAIEPTTSDTNTPTRNDTSSANGPPTIETTDTPPVAPTPIVAEKKLKPSAVEAINAAAAAAAPTPASPSSSRRPSVLSG
jgi:hypothetical protein